MAKVLVTGCAGFIGSHLCRRLLKLGHTVRGIDDLSVGFKENIDDLTEYISHGPEDNTSRFIPQHSAWNYCIADIRDHKLSSMAKFGSSWNDFDVVYHLAARGETYWCQENPSEAVDVNVNGTLRMLEFAKTTNCSHFVFADTSAEYDGLTGKDWYPTDEDDAPNQHTPMGIYSITKMTASQFVRAWSIENNVRSTLFRPFNVYGPSMNLDRDIPPVIGSIAVKLLKNQSPTIYGDGSKRRDFIYIDDAIDLLVKALPLANIRNIRNINLNVTDTFNMGTGENYSINEIHDIIASAIVKELPLSKVYPLPHPIYEPDKPYEAKITLADVNKARRTFDWSPKVSIEEGIRRTINDVKRRM